MPGIAAALAGMVFQQSSYRAGALNASMPTMTVAKPTVGMDLLGVIVLGENCASATSECSSSAAAVAVMVVSTVALARGEADRDGGARQAAVHSHFATLRRRNVSLMAC